MAQVAAVQLKEVHTDELGRAYMAGYMDALNNERGKRKEAKRRIERKRYFAMQKLTGIVILAFTALAVKVLDGDATIAFLTIPLGIALLTSKEMLIANKYYWRTKEGEE